MAFAMRRAWPLMAASCLAAQPEVEVSWQGPEIVFQMEDARPMGLDDLASVFPVAGPFGYVEGQEVSDRFLKEFLQQIEPVFREKLVPILASRFPDAVHPCDEDVKRHCLASDSPLHCLGLHAPHLSSSCVAEVQHSVPFGCSGEIHRHCNHGPREGLLHCLEELGVHLGSQCADAVVAARQALASIHGSEQRASAAMGVEDHHHQHHDAQDHHHSHHQDHHSHHQDHHSHHKDQHDHHSHHQDNHNHQEHNHHDQHDHNKHHHDHNDHRKHHHDHHDQHDHNKHHNKHHHQDHQDHQDQKDHQNHQQHHQDHHDHKQEHHPDHRHGLHAKHATGTCPPAWEGPKAGGCCTRRWAASCNLACSVEDCGAAGWEFRWADFRTHPYICCPKAERRQYLGGQQICPEGWQVEEHGHGHCCRKPWTWECGEHCAQEQCKRDVALAWYPVDDKQEHYKCCPEMTMDSPGMSVEEEVAQVGMFPEVLTVGSSWVSRPIDLSGSTLGGILVGVLAVLLWLMWLCSAPVQHHQRHVQKDH